MYAFRPPLNSSAATLNPFFSCPTFSGAPHRLLAVDAAIELSLLALFLHVSDTPAISVCICAVVCDGSVQPSLCARFWSRALLFQASFSFFALLCVVKSKVSLCILSANYGGGFRVGSIHVFAISIVLVNAHVHVHVGSASGSHRAILNTGCDGLGHHCTVSSL